MPNLTENASSVVEDLQQIPFETCGPENGVTQQFDIGRWRRGKTVDHIDQCLELFGVCQSFDSRRMNFEFLSSTTRVASLSPQNSAIVC